MRMLRPSDLLFAEKPGVCPKARPGTITICPVRCRSDWQCDGKQKCCTYACITDLGVGVVPEPLHSVEALWLTSICLPCSLLNSSPPEPSTIGRMVANQFSCCWALCRRRWLSCQASQGTRQ
uniref:WAP domain-containing protein n=1 Tax=Laticauda laticaudata TaxID=8630 RepID=A0A8C5RP69_LATLA